jgi:hypothetical protein
MNRLSRGAVQGNVTFNLFLLSVFAPIGAWQTRAVIVSVEYARRADERRRKKAAGVDHATR